MHRPLLACLLPVRNGAEHLDGWLESVGRFADVVIALDDGSTDDTRARLDASPLVAAGAREPRSALVRGLGRRAEPVPAARRGGGARSPLDHVPRRRRAHRTGRRRRTARLRRTRRRSRRRLPVPRLPDDRRPRALRPDASRGSPACSPTGRGCASPSPGCTSCRSRNRSPRVAGGGPRSASSTSPGSPTTRDAPASTSTAKPTPTTPSQRSYATPARTAAAPSDRGGRDHRISRCSPNEPVVRCPHHHRPTRRRRRSRRSSSRRTTRIGSRRAVRAVVAQEVPGPFEVIVVTSGRDRTAEIVRDRFPTVDGGRARPSGRSPVQARNAGLRRGARRVRHLPRLAHRAAAGRARSPAPGPSPGLCPRHALGAQRHANRRRVGGLLPGPLRRPARPPVGATRPAPRRAARTRAMRCWRSGGSPRTCAPVRTPS